MLWTRLSAICGTDWAHDNSLINGRALPSLEAVSTMLPGFSKNLFAAIKTIETMTNNFQSKIKSVEKDLWREYQTLENHLDQRTKKLDRLESIVRNGIATGQINPHSHTLNEAQARVARLEDAYRQLKVENHTLRAAADARRAAYAEHNGPESPGGSPSPSVPTGPKAKASASKIPKSGSRSALSRPATAAATPSRTSSQHYHFHSHHSRQNLAPEEANRSRGGSPAAHSASGTPTPAGDDDDTITTLSGQQQQPGGSSSTAVATTTTSATSTMTRSTASPTTLGVNTLGGAVDTKWMLRLKDLEYKLKAEREGRLMDRGEAMKRINASEVENEALRGDLERERERRKAGR